MITAKNAFLLFLIVAVLSTGCPIAHAARKASVVDPRRNWEFRYDLKYLFASDTSYQFGDQNVEPSDKPLSRLEFPLNTIFIGGELRRNFPRYSVGVNALTSVMRNTRGRMKDSDWTNSDNPDERTIFSTSANRMEYGVILGTDIDVTIADWLHLPRSLDLRPLIGFQWQEFSMMAHDGVQHEYNPVEPDTPLPGNALHFLQDYLQYFLGLRGTWDIGRPLNLPPLKASSEVRWGYVTAYNDDHHLLRQGIRHTFEKTDGWSFYVSGGLKANLTDNIILGASVDYLIIRTTGSHRWYHELVEADETWSKAVKVWSDQVGVKLDMTYRF